MTDEYSDLTVAMKSRLQAEQEIAKARANDEDTAWLEMQAAKTPLFLELLMSIRMLSQLRFEGGAAFAMCEVTERKAEASKLMEALATKLTKDLTAAVVSVLRIEKPDFDALSFEEKQRHFIQFRHCMGDALADLGGMTMLMMAAQSMLPFDLIERTEGNA